jgi:ABC-2 type transport system ATP-binding protein
VGARGPAGPDGLSRAGRIAYVAGSTYGEAARGDLLLALRGVGKAYGALVALRGLDLELRAGECVALVGHNGSGKTTALRISAGSLEASEGGVWVGDTELRGGRDDPVVRRFVAFVPDEPVFYDDLSVVEPLELVGVAHGLAEGLDARIRAVLERFGLGGREDFLPGQLSRGLRQKVQLSCALLRPFSVLLLDEPVVGLDPASQEALRGALLDLKAEGKAVLLSTHQIGFARGLANRAVILEEGQVLASGPYEATVEREEALRFGLS